MIEKINKHNQEVSEFRESATKQQGEILNYLKRKRNDLFVMSTLWQDVLLKSYRSTVRANSRDMVAHLLGFCLTASDAESSHGIFSSALSLEFQQLESRHSCAQKGSKSLLDAFDEFDEFLQQMKTMQADNPTKFTGKWKEDDDEGRNILRAALGVSETDVDEHLRYPTEKRVKIADAELEEDANVLFSLVEEGQVNVVEKGPWTMGQFVQITLKSAEKIVTMLPEVIEQ